MSQLPNFVPTPDPGQTLHLIRLADARRHLERELAGVLRRVGPDHPRRRAVNTQRAVRRKQLRRALRHNAAEIAAIICEVYP